MFLVWHIDNPNKRRGPIQNSRSFWGRDFIIGLLCACNLPNWEHCPVNDLQTYGTTEWLVLLVLGIPSSCCSAQRQKTHLNYRVKTDEQMKNERLLEVVGVFLLGWITCLKPSASHAQKNPEQPSWSSWSSARPIATWCLEKGSKKKQRRHVFVFWCFGCHISLGANGGSKGDGVGRCWSKHLWKAATSATVFS